MSKKLPKGWIGCPRSGVVVANKFLPFKTPLDSGYNRNVPPSDRFNLEMLFDFAATMQSEIKLFIDLTNTDRYYSSAELSRYGVEYFKLACHGHGVPPSPGQLRTFISVCHQFFQSYNNHTRNNNCLPNRPTPVVGIHCTHGFNRTGFLICAYLVEVEGWTLFDAISKFAQARPPGIYREDYFKFLMNLYGSNTTSLPAVPSTPSWCAKGGRNSQANINNVEMAELTVDESYSNPEIEMQRGLARRKDIVRHCRGVLPAEAYQWQPVRDAISGFLGGHNNVIGGSSHQPKPFSRASFELLRNKEFLVSCSTGGTRYLMYLDPSGKVFLVDSDNYVFFIPRLEFSKPNQPLLLTNSLLDGELVLEKLSDGSKRPCYLANDLIAFNGQSLVDIPFGTRLDSLMNKFIQCCGRYDRRSLQPLNIQVKDFVAIGKSKEFLSQELPYETADSGLTFYPAAEPYTGNKRSLIVWRSSDSESSTFFRLKILPNFLPDSFRNEQLVEQGELLTGIGKGKEKLFAKIKITDELRQLNGRIIECTFDSSSIEWKLTRERADLSHPNNYKRASAVFRRVKNAVSLGELLAFIDKLPK